MAIELEEEARDELLCEIDHWKERAEKAEAMLEEAREVCAITTKRADTATRLLRKFTKAMGMHVGLDHEIALCDADDKARAFLEAKP